LIPGIYFFIEKRDKDKFINILGINVTENGNALKNLFYVYERKVEATL
jgi:hypothetical protein